MNPFTVGFPGLPGAVPSGYRYVCEVLESTSLTAWQPPESVLSDEVLVSGTGAGGGGRTAAANDTGCGGDAGRYVFRRKIKLSTYSPVAITVGIGGAENTNGGDTIFGSLTMSGGISGLLLTGSVTLTGAVNGTGGPLGSGGNPSQASNNHTVRPAGYGGGGAGGWDTGAGQYGANGVLVIEYFMTV